MKDLEQSQVKKKELIVAMTETLNVKLRYEQIIKNLLENDKRGELRLSAVQVIKSTQPVTINKKQSNMQSSSHEPREQNKIHLSPAEQVNVKIFNKETTKMGKDSSHSPENLKHPVKLLKKRNNKILSPNSKTGKTYSSFRSFGDQNID